MKEKKFKRNCPRCNVEIFHTTKYACNNAIEAKSPCRSCSKTKDIPSVRNCPRCKEEIHYKNKHNCKDAEKEKRICKKCMYKDNSKRFSGENNPFYSKKHTQEVKDKISDFNRNERVLSEEFIEKARENLSKVTNSTPLYEIWLKKHGKEIADKKLVKLKEKQSKNNSGQNNPMYGKPAPEGSGNGWSGWYNGWYFRSLRELSYMINVIEVGSLDWKTPNKKFKIPYIDYDGQQRNYFPDFVIGNKIIEIKPERLFDTPKVLAKKKAAEEFVKQNNMEYEIVDPPILSDEEIKELYVSGKIKFLERYEEKFKDRYYNE